MGLSASYKRSVKNAAEPKKTTKQEVWHGHTCGECGRGAWATDPNDVDVNGKPFVKKCEFATWYNDLTLRGSAACEHYV